MQIIVIIFLLWLIKPIYCQQSIWDSLNIQYEIIYSEFLPSQDVIKIKVPPYLSTVEVMEQVRLAIHWPGSPPPTKRTRIYVFKATDHYGAKSKTGAVFIPGKGFKWSLRDWKPDSSLVQQPSAQEIQIYNALLDSMFKIGLGYTNRLARQKVARRFNLTAGKLDTIYYKVKFWLDIQKKSRKSMVKLSDELNVKIR